MDLPTELRDRIYELCLARTRLFIRPRPHLDRRYSGWKQYDKPEWQLPRVSHQVRYEAAKILFSWNIVILGYRGFDGIDTDMPYGLVHYISRNVVAGSITLDVRGYTRNMLDFIGHGRFVTEVRKFGLGEPSTEPNLTLQLHNLTGMSISVWKSQMMFFRNARYLQVDISHCYCPLGCHRMIKEVVEVISEFSWWKPPELLVVLGVKGKAESKAIIDKVQELLQRAKREHVKGAMHFKAFKPSRHSSTLDRADLEEDLEDQVVQLSSLLTTSNAEPVARENLVGTAKFDALTLESPIDETQSEEGVATSESDLTSGEESMEEEEMSEDNEHSNDEE